MQRLIFVLFLIAYPLCLTAAFADTVYLKSGESLKGLVVEEHRDRIVLSTEAGEQTFFRRDLDDVFYDDPERNYLYLGEQALEAENFSAARGFFRKALQIYPEFQEADDALKRLEDLQRKRSVSWKAARPEADLEGQWGLLLSAYTPSSGPSRPWPRVEKAKPGSLAERLRLLPGDELISFWGDSLAFFSPSEAAEVLLGPTKTPVKLTIQRRVLLAPNPTGRDWPGLELEMSRMGLTVSKVEPKQPAASSGLLAGDRIVQLGEISTRYLPLPEARKVFQDSKTQGILMTVHRDLHFDRE
ncbi:MAG: hypothetical protein HYZ90_02545 [Candidatus Omnitrophica bacterium]|nr:hypothetical protein [Candidatus Omnitrophota bacterium]